MKNIFIHLGRINFNIITIIVILISGCNDNSVSSGNSGVPGEIPSTQNGALTGNWKLTKFDGKMYSGNMIYTFTDVTFSHFV